MRRFLPVLVLILITPVVAELLAGSTPISQPMAFLIDLLIYGPGALLIREVVRRSGRGWGSILLLGAAYGIIEEGLILQSFFNPTLYAASQYGARIFGINGTYMEAMLIYHPIWSAAVPILITELLFPARRNTPYLGWFGLVVTAIFYVFGAFLLGLGVRVSLAPGYWAPPQLLGLAVIAVLILAVVALLVLPKKVVQFPYQGRAPSPWILLLVSGFAGFVSLALLILLGRVVPVLTHGWLVLIPMLSTLVLVVVMVWLVRRWSQASNWGDLHRLALVSGALFANTLSIGVLNSHHTTTDRVGIIVLGLVAAALLSILAMWIRDRNNAVFVSDNR